MKLIVKKIKYDNYLQEIWTQLQSIISNILKSPHIRKNFKLFVKSLKRKYKKIKNSLNMMKKKYKKVKKCSKI